MGALGYRPLNTWLSAAWLIFDQWVFAQRGMRLSTLLSTAGRLWIRPFKPVDNSVGNPWKDWRRQRRYWRGAIALGGTGLHRFVAGT
jgi:hypothetical protein